MGVALRCIYCSVNSNEQKDKKLRMSFDLAKIAIDRVIQSSMNEQKPFTIVFIGKGEPTLNWRVLFKCAEHIKKRKKELGVNGKTIIVTNGILSKNKAI